MRYIKRILTLFAVATAFLFVGTPKASAQWAVTDIPLLAQEIIAWTDEIISAGDQLVKLGESVEKAEQMVQKTKQIIDKTKEIYNKIDPYIESGKKVYEIYRATEQIGFDFKMLEEYIKTFGDSKVSPSKVRAIRMLAAQLATELEWIVKDVQEVLNPVTNLTTKDREDAVKERNEDLNKIHEALQNTIYQDAMGMINSEFERSIETGALAAFGMIQSLEDEQKSAARFEEIYKTAAEKIRKQSGTKPTDAELYNSNASGTIDRVFNLVTIIIGAMAVLMLVWAFGTRMKGEPQHQDALWKVFAGLIFIFLLLQVIKVTIFGANGFDILLPKF